MLQAVISVVVADDVAELRELVRLALEEEPGTTVVGEASDGRAAVAVVSELRPAAVLLDLSMPHMDGLEAIPMMRDAVPDLAIVVLSGFGAERMASQALERGADRYLEKGAPLSSIRAAVLEAVLARRSGKVTT